MGELQKPSNDVLRRNAENECGTPVAQINVKINGIPDIQTISFYCNKPRLHTDECAFVGAQAIVRARPRDDGRGAINLLRP